MVRLTAPNGVSVTVDKDHVDGLLARGFTKAESKTATKKAAAKKSSK